MKILRKIALLGLTIILMSSCKKSFLDLHSKEATDARLAIVDIESMDYAIHGVYALMQNSDYYNRTFYLLPDLMSDNVYLSHRNRYYSAFDKYEFTADNSYVEGTWGQILKVIVNSNFIIQKGSDIEVPDKDTAKQNAIVGEAYAIRALANFDLCRMYAQPYNFTSDASHPGVPLILKSSISIDDLTYPSRSSVKEVYTAVVEDFKEAIKRLPKKIPGQSSSFKGMITLNTARALLSRVYLYMGDWSDCEEMATEVINSRQYSLLATNDLVSEYSSQNTSESIFEIINTFTDNSGSNSAAYYYNQAGYGDALPTWDLYNTYAPTDVRRDFMGIGNRSGSGGEKNVPLVTKYMKLGGNFEQDVIVIRLAEVYLNRAEADAHLAQDSAALADLGTIAERADPAVVINPALTGQDLINRVLLERRKELAFEGQRLFDLTRNKLSFYKYRTGGDSTMISYPSDNTIFPIPQNERDVNINLAQNPGY